MDKYIVHTHIRTVNYSFDELFSPPTYQNYIMAIWIYFSFGILVSKACLFGLHLVPTTFVVNRLHPWKSCSLKSPVIDCFFDSLSRPKSQKHQVCVTGPCRWIHRWPVNSPHTKGPLTQQRFYLITSSCKCIRGQTRSQGSCAM